MAAFEQRRTEFDLVSDSAVGRSATICRADDLKGFLQQLSEQIADADRRHSEALHDMHERLSRLGGQTGSLKATMPKEFSADLERLEAGMASLVQRIVESDQARPAQSDGRIDAAPVALAAVAEVESTVEALPAAEVSPTAKFSDDADYAHEHDHQPTVSPNWTDPSRAALLSAAPPALKSAVSSSAPTWSPVAPALAAAAVATPVVLAVVAPAPQKPISPSEEPWDNQSAEALVRLYASGEPGLPPAPVPVYEPAALEMARVAPVSMLAGVPQPLAAAAVAPVITAPSVVEEAREAIDRAWFEDRLNEMASRVEQSLSDLAPDDAIANLGRRFDQLEERWSTALSDVATRSDVDGIRLVEAHIAELTQRLDEAQGQLARLDQIEKQLTELGGQLTDENVVRLFGNLVPTEEDLSHFAEMAAEKVAIRFIEQMPVAVPLQAVAQVSGPDVAAVFEVAHQASAERINALQQMLAGFIDERRRGEVETAEALETMQHAMQHVLDRVDQFDTARPAQMHGPVAAMQQMAAAPMVPSFAPEARESFDDVRNSVKAAAAAASASRLPAGAQARMGTDSGQPRRIEPHLDHELEVRLDAPEGRGGAADRRSVVDTARRAADKAAEMAKIAAAAEVVPKAKAGGVRDRLLGTSAKGEKGGVNKQLLVLLPCIALALVGVWAVARPKPMQVTPATVVIDDGGPVVPGAKPGSKPSMAPAIAPAGNLEVPAPGAKPETQQPAKPEQRGDVPGLRNREQADAGQSIVTGAIPANESRVVAGPFAGIAVQQTGNAMTVEEAMRAREKARIASLSQRTAQNAALSSSVTPAAFPAALQTEGEEPVASAQPEGKTMLELPPALVGPLSLRLAAAKGDPSAQFEVAARFAEGKGIKQDFAQAASWYQRAAAQGMASAQYRLAALYERGLGLKADPQRARLWYKRAAEQGSVKAMHNLAVLSASRDQGSADYPTAVQWFGEAAERGLSDSQYNLAVLYESGLGVPKDLVAAYKWYAIAARSGDSEAIRRQQLLKSKIDAGTLQKAEDSIEIWRPRPTEGLANDALVAGSAWKARANGSPTAQAN